MELEFVCTKETCLAGNPVMNSQKWPRLFLCDQKLVIGRLARITFLLLVCHLAWPNSNFGQQQQAIFPELSGDELLEALQANYTPATVQGFAVARDSLFGRIDQVNDSLRCVYTGYKIYLDPNEDPTVAAYMNGSGLNTEHTYPQAKGASTEPARADMHHLFPTRVDINQARDNFPFAEIPDQVTERWFYLNQFRSTIPTSNIDAYSEVRNGAFEPPEAHKGDVARAMFYFYTIYRDRAMAADPNYFAGQMQTLCNWHYLDPVDEKEWNRTWEIAHYQDGKANPFVLDCSLAQRLYCSQTQATCLVDSPRPPEEVSGIRLQPAFPNPFQQSLTLPFVLAQEAQLNYSLYNGRGQVLMHPQRLSFSAGEHRLEINKTQYPQLIPGFWWVKLDIQMGSQTIQKWIKVVYQE